MKAIYQFIILLILFCSITVQAKVIGKIRYSKGQVWVDGKIAKKNDQLKNHQTIKTGERALAILSFDGGSTVKLQASTSLKVKYSKIKEIEKTIFRLIKGSLFTRFHKSSTSNLNIQTKTASLGVRGTEFFTSYGKKGSKDLWMCVNKGKVAVRAKGEKNITLVKEGEGIVVKISNNLAKTSAPKPLPWTKKLNWKLDPKMGDLENIVNIEDAYTDPLEQDYD